MAGGEIKDMPAVWKEPRPAMGRVLLRVWKRQCRRSSSRGGDPKESAADVRGEDDHAARTPGTTAIVQSIANGLDRASRDVLGLQLPVREERDRAAIGRPEWKLCSFRPRQRSRDSCPQGLDPELRACAENRALAIGGKHDRGRIVSRQPKRCLFRRNQEGVNRPRPRAAQQPVFLGEIESARERESGRHPGKPLAGLALRGGGGGRRADCGTSAIHRSSFATSPADCQRSSGSLARHVSTRRSSANGAIGAIEEIAGGCDVMTAEMRDAWLVPAKAFFPVTIS